MNVRETAAGVEIDVRVIPRSAKTLIGGERHGALLVRLAAPPVEGAANDALVRLLAARLRVPTRRVRIVTGERGRQKRVLLEGMTAIEVRHLLQEPADG